MPDVSLPWDQGELVVSLPQHWQCQQVATTSLPAAPPDWREPLAMALTQPIAGPPLSRALAACANGRIALIVEDLTRHSPLPEILAVVMREVRHAGIADEQVEIVLAVGMHPPLTPAEAGAKLGPAVEGIRRRSNPWHDPKAYVSVGRVGNLAIQIDRGVAEADLRIIVSSVSPHLQAGFGGGYKMLLPGCAARETIRGLHRMGLGRTDRQLVGTTAEQNPMRAAIDAAGKRLDAAGGRSFAVQYILDNDNLPTFVAAGEVAPVQQMLAKRCAAACGIVMGQPADVLVTNAFPRDLDLWQSFKSIVNTRWAVRPNGVIVCLSRCPAGLNEMQPVPWPLSPDWTRRLIRMLGAEALSSLLTRLVPSLAGDAAFFVRLAARTLHRNPLYLVSPALAEADVHFPGIELFANAAEAFAAAQELLGDGPQRVTVFPAGGVTYPVIEPLTGGV